jgi:hypothetical protein
MVLTIATGLIVGSIYWNEQQYFGVTLPQSKIYCVPTVEGAPDRGMVILMRNGAVCPDENNVGILDYIQEKNEPAIIISSRYNTPGDYKNTLEYAQAECGDRKLFAQKIPLGEIYSCKQVLGRETILRSYIQINREPERYGPVNVSISLKSSRREDVPLYWNAVRSMTINVPR